MNRLVYMVSVLFTVMLMAGCGPDRSSQDEYGADHQEMYTHPNDMSHTDTLQPPSEYAFVVKILTS